MNVPRCLLAEALGTFFFCFAGIGAIVSTQPPINSGIGLVGIALAFSLSLTVSVNVFGGISGAHFNPAVTIGFLLTKRISFGAALLYIPAQIVGASLAAWACHLIWPAEAVELAKLGITLPPVLPGEGVEWPTVPIVFGVEFLLTFLLMVAIYGTAIDERGQAVNISAFGIGFAVAFDIFAGGPITGASMNPARSFGPSLVLQLLGGEASTDAFALHWVYWAAPIAGAVVGAWVYEGLLLGEDE